MKELVCALLDRLLAGKKTIVTDLPSSGVITLQEQGTRLITHILYVVPVLRGGVQVIEDMVPVYDIHVFVRTSRKIERCYLAPSGKEIAFRQTKDGVEYVVPEVNCHAVAVLDYSEVEQ